MVVQTMDSDVQVYPFTDYEKAKKYLHKIWDNAVIQEISLEQQLDLENTYAEDEYAKLTWADGDHIEYILSYLTREIDPE